MSPDVTGQGNGYVTLDTMGALGLDESYTELRMRVAESTDDEAHILAIVDQIEEQLESSGRPVLGPQDHHRNLCRSPLSRPSFSSSPLLA